MLYLLFLACNAESGELGCEDIVGSTPSVNQEESVTSPPHHQHHWPTEKVYIICRKT